jgi:hypothetical protein
MRLFNSKQRPFRFLTALISLLVLAALLLPETVEAFAEGFGDDCSNDCNNDCSNDRNNDCNDGCTSACGCMNCPPSLYIIDISLLGHSALPMIVSQLALDFSLNPEQKWFNSIDHPPQNSC